jgi:hypothetical protein
VLTWAFTGGHPPEVPKLCAVANDQVNALLFTELAYGMRPSGVQSSVDRNDLNVYVSEIPPYDQVPPRRLFTPASDIPSFARAPGRLRAVFAKNAREGDPVVDIRCGIQQGSRQCRKRLAGVWSTPHGEVLVVNAQVDDTSLRQAYKENMRPSLEPDHLAEEVDEEPILLTDVRTATLWCRQHGSWQVDLPVLRQQVDHWRETGRSQTMPTSPPGSLSTVRKRSARRV